MLALPKDGLLNYSLCLPDEALRREFDNLVTPILRRMESSVEQTRALAATRDALLPKLISGELRVKLGNAA